MNKRSPRSGGHVTESKLRSGGHVIESKPKSRGHVTESKPRSGGHVTESKPRSDDAISLLAIYVSYVLYMNSSKVGMFERHERSDALPTKPDRIEARF